MNQDSKSRQDGQILRFPDRRQSPPVSRTGWEAHWQTFLQVTREALATADDDPMDERDHHAIADEYVFKTRFGFVRPRRDREHLLHLKHDADLTDAEIIALKHAGALSFRRDGVHLLAERWLAAYGWLVLGFLGLMESLAWTATLQRGGVPPILLLKLVSLTLVFGGLGWIVHQIHVRPWQIAKRVRQRHSVDST